MTKVRDEGKGARDLKHVLKRVLKRVAWSTSRRSPYACLLDGSGSQPQELSQDRMVMFTACEGRGWCLAQTERGNGRARRCFMDRSNGNWALMITSFPKDGSSLAPKIRTGSTTLTRRLTSANGSHHREVVPDSYSYSYTAPE